MGSDYGGSIYTNEMLHIMVFSPWILIVKY